MEIKGTATDLSTTTTQFADAGAVWVFNTGSAQTVTVRNAADDAAVGTAYIGAGAGITIHLPAGQGVRGASTLKATEIVRAGF